MSGSAQPLLQLDARHTGELHVDDNAGGLVQRLCNGCRCATAQRDRECRAPFWIVAGGDGASMRVDDRPYDRKAYPEAVRFRRDEGREQRAENMRRQPGPVSRTETSTSVGPDVAAVS